MEQFMFVIRRCPRKRLRKKVQKSHVNLKHQPRAEERDGRTPAARCEIHLAKESQDQNLIRPENTNERSPITEKPSQLQHPVY